MVRSASAALTLTLAALLPGCATVDDGPADTDTDAPLDLPGCAPATWTPPPACGSGPVVREAVLPGPGAPGHDADLAALVAGHDRLYAAFGSAGQGANTEVVVPLDATELRAALAAHAVGDGPDLAQALGGSVTGSGAVWQKVAGAYAGVGIAADAMRYAVLRDEGAACAEVDAARAQLVRGMEALHRASVITGVPGVIARGFAANEAWSYGSQVETVPLFDEGGAPLPAEKTNGTWREDTSGTLPGWRWEDSCSRDMLIGWTMGFGAVWETVARDPTVPDDLKDALQADARALAHSLMTVQESGYDLEIRDADGRMTYHGILHEDSIDRVYVPDAGNGLNAVMALGAMAALALVAEDEVVDAWVQDELITARDLPGIVRDRVGLIDFGLGSNYSNHNMAYIGGVQAQRWLCDADARTAVAQGLDAGLYDRAGRDRQPIEQGQSLYDLVTALARAGGGAWWPVERAVDPVPVEAALGTLRDWPDAPAYDVERINCDALEIEAGSCEAVDGSTITLAAGLGRNDVLVAAHPLPFPVRPPSNYTWRSNPYAVHGEGTGSVHLPGVDLRIVYWLGRWATATPRDAD